MRLPHGTIRRGGRRDRVTLPSLILGQELKDRKKQERHRDRQRERKRKGESTERAFSVTTTMYTHTLPLPPSLTLSSCTLTTCLSFTHSPILPLFISLPFSLSIQAPLWASPSLSLARTEKRESGSSAGPKQQQQQQ